MSARAHLVIANNEINALKVQVNNLRKELAEANLVNQGLRAQLNSALKKDNPFPSDVRFKGGFD